MTTFSQSAKNEILRSTHGYKECCQKAFLYGAVKSCGSLNIGKGGLSISLDSENVAFLKLCGELAEKLFGVSYRLEQANVSAKGVAIYTAYFDGELALRLGLTYSDKDGVLHISQRWDKSIIESPCCKRAFFQSLFVACGSVVIPFTDNDDLAESKSSVRYHLELRLYDEQFADNLCQEAQDMGFHKTKHKNRTVLYIKDSEKIADFLVYLNAMSAKLKLENVIIGRSLRNTANRQSNCISANIDKALAASEKQLEAIEKLQQQGKLDSLPPTLLEAAKVRQQFPEATIEEIAAKLGISKSGANHRLNKLIQLCQ